MKSFFTKIQNKFSASYGGRYVETILEEISKTDPSIIKHLFSKKVKNSHLVSEYHFSINGQERIADLALISIESGKPLAFAEVKYDDHKNLKNEAQLDDYIRYCNLNNCEFVYLTQYYPPLSDLRKIKQHGYNHFLFSDFAEKLLKENIHELTSLFIDYLKDKGLVMEKISHSHIGKLLVRLFNPVKGQRVQSNIDMTQKIPENFSALMTNINVISQEISQYLKSDRNPSIDFQLHPSYKITKAQIKELLEKGDKGKIEFAPELNNKNGGILYIYAKSSLVKEYGKDDWSYLEFGYYFEIERGSTEFLCELYSTIGGKYIDPERYYFSKKIGSSVISDKKKCVTYIKSLIIKSINAVMKDHKIRSLSSIKKEIEMSLN